MILNVLYFFFVIIDFMHSFVFLCRTGCVYVHGLVSLGLAVWESPIFTKLLCSFYGLVARRGGYMGRPAQRDVPFQNLALMVRELVLHRSSSACGLIGSGLQNRNGCSV